MNIDQLLTRTNSGKPLLGGPGCLDIRLGYPPCPVRVVLSNWDERFSVAQRLRKTGGLSHFEVVRSPQWRAKGQMQILANDTIGIQSIEIGVVDWMSDEEFEAWVAAT